MRCKFVVIKTRINTNPYRLPVKPGWADTVGFYGNQKAFAVVRDISNDCRFHVIHSKTGLALYMNASIETAKRILRLADRALRDGLIDAKKIRSGNKKIATSAFSSEFIQKLHGAR